MSNTRVRFGSLILHDGGDRNANGTAWRYVVHGDDFSTGDPVPIEVTIQSLLQDSSIVTRTRDDNREASATVTVIAPDSAALAQGVAALEAETNKRNEFGFLQPDVWTAESVFDVVTSSLAQAQQSRGRPADMALVNDGEVSMTFGVRLVCEAFCRPNDKTTSPALAAPAASPVVNTIDAGSATTHWTAKTGNLADLGSYLELQNTLSPQVTWTGTYDATTTPYLTLITRISGVVGQPNSPRLIVNNAEAQYVATTPVAGGWFALTFKTTVTAVTSVQFRCDDVGLNYARRLQFYSLTASNLPPYNGTQRQSVRAVTVAGTARTQGSFEVSHPTSPLGTVLVYTWNGNPAYSPPLRQYRVSGGAVTTDASTISGAYEGLLGNVTFDIPVSQLLDGRHQIVLRVKAAGGSDVDSNLTWGVRTKIGSLVLGSWGGVTTFAGVSHTDYQFRTLAITPLTPIALPESSTAMARIFVSSSAGLVYDEGWALNLQAGDLTWIEAGTSNTRAWIDTPSATRPLPGIFVGNAADRSDAYHLGTQVPAFGNHEFLPDNTTAFVVTSTALAADVDLEYHRRSRYLVAPDPV